MADAGAGAYLIVYCLIASFSESGLGGASQYLLDLTVAASLLTLPSATGSGLSFGLRLPRRRRAGRKAARLAESRRTANRAQRGLISSSVTGTSSCHPVGSRLQPGWRNRQTRRPQKPLFERTCGFKSRSGHATRATFSLFTGDRGLREDCY